jgi:hypothetical protein
MLNTQYGNIPRKFQLASVKVESRNIIAMAAKLDEDMFMLICITEPEPGSSVKIFYYAGPLRGISSEKLDSPSKSSDHNLTAQR